MVPVARGRNIQLHLDLTILSNTSEGLWERGEIIQLLLWESLALVSFEVVPRWVSWETDSERAFNMEHVY